MQKTRVLAFALGIFALTAPSAFGQWPAIERQDPGYYPNGPDQPSSRMNFYSGRNVEFRYPANWQVIENSNSLTVVPAGGFASAGVAYGMIVSAFDPNENPFPVEDSLNVFSGDEARPLNLSSATDLIISRLRESNPDMRILGNSQPVQVAGRDALMTEIENTSTLGGFETDWLVTVLRPDGVLQYFIGVAPRMDFDEYRPVFERMIETVRFPD